jgi:hypothetical protein
MSLTSYLQQAFSLQAPPGWRCTHEVAVLADEVTRVLGFFPRADVLLEEGATGRRIWIEFEISRADPAANHLKFAVGHVFSPQLEQDAFVSMVSRHVAAGRSNLGAAAVMLMRRIGMRAFQVPLLPALPAPEIKQLNHLPADRLDECSLDIGREIERAIVVTEPVLTDELHRLFFVSNAFEVSLNVVNWNRDARDPGSAARWGRRTVTYFIFDPRSGFFAPSKFCAYLPVPSLQNSSDTHQPDRTLGMTLDYYCAVAQQEPRFDGAAARRHLLYHLGYQLIKPGASPELHALLQAWLINNGKLIRVHPRDAHVLIPP